MVLLTDKKGTKIIELNRNTIIKYYDTDIVTFNKAKIVLNSGGHLTPTTRIRMNQASKTFDLGFVVHQKDFKWIVTAGGRNTIIRTVPFYDGIEIFR